MFGVQLILACPEFLIPGAIIREKLGNRCDLFFVLLFQLNFSNIIFL